MINLKQADTKSAKILYSAIIIIAAIGLPFYFLAASEDFVFEINSNTIFITVLYFIFIAGFVFLVFNIGGSNVASTVEIIRKILFPVVLFFISIRILWLVYNLWRNE